MDQSRIDSGSARASTSSVDENLSTTSKGASTGSLPSSEAERLSALRADKADAIRTACTSRDLDALVEHATSEGGLLDDELRQIACELVGFGHWMELILSTKGPSFYNVTKKHDMMTFRR